MIKYKGKALILLMCLFLLNKTAYSQWVSANGPNGAQMIFAAVKGSTIIAGCSTSGFNHGQLFTSTDSGATWTPVLCADGELFTDAAFLDTSIFVSGEDLGIFRSDDNGMTWTVVSGSLGTPIIYSVEVLGNQLFAAGISVYVSSNNGVSWTPSNTGLPAGTINDLATNGQQLYAANYSQVFRSDDQGQTWQNTNIGIAGVYLRGIAARDSNVFFGTEEDGVFYSTNLGANWLYAGLNNFEITDVAFFGDTLTASTDNGIFYSINSGATWDSLNTGLSARNVKTIYSNDTIMMAGTTGGLCRINQTQGEWELIGVPATDVVSLGGFGDVIFASTYNEDGISAGILVSLDNGESWVNRDNGLPGAESPGSIAHSLLGVGNKMLIGWQSLGVYLTADTGNTWTAMNYGLPVTLVGYLTMHNGIIYAAADSGRIYSSADTAQTWGLFSTLPTNLAGYYQSINFVDSTIYIPTGGQVGFVISYDFGQTWVNSNSGLAGLNIWSFAMIDSIFLVGTQPAGPFRSENSGVDWSPVNMSLTPPWVNSMTVVNNTFIAGTLFSEGILFSPDQGINWYDFNEGLFPEHEFLDIRCFYQNNDFLFMGTGSAAGRFSVYKRPLNDFTGISSSASEANAASVYPNPTSGNVYVRLKNTVANGSLEIFDITGKSCYFKSLHNCNELNLDLQHLVPGLYLITIHAEGGKVTSKRIVVN